MTGPGTLGFLVGGMPVPAFVQTIWGRDIRHFEGCTAGAAAPLTLESFEAALAALNRAHEGWLHLADQGLRRIPPDFIDAEGMLDMDLVGAAFASGQTLYLTKAERILPSLADLCAGIAGDLAAHGVAMRSKVNAHVFLTPPQSQGFAPHRDEHASFILQLEGVKSWTIYAPSSDGAEKDQLPHPGPVDDGTLSRHRAMTVTLSPNDVLYMPEWWPHEARAGTTHSLHVTIRMFPLRWVDLLRDVCARHPALAGAIPPQATGSLGTLATRLGELLRAPGFFGDLTLPPALSPRPDNAGRGSRLRGAVRSDEVALDTTLVRASGMSCRVHEADDMACLSYSGGTIKGPGAFLPVFLFIAQSSRLRPRDLPTTDAEYDRIEVAKRLVSAGLMRIDETGG